MNYSKKQTSVSPEVKMTKSIGKEELGKRGFSFSHQNSNTGTHALGKQLRTKDAFNQEAIL